MALGLERSDKLQDGSVQKFAEKLVEGSGSFDGCMITADRSSGEGSTMSTIMKFGMSSIFVMPENSLLCHLFLGNSFLNPFWSGIEDAENKDVSIRLLGRTS